MDRMVGTMAPRPRHIHHHRTGSPGFTLVELLVVIAIVVLLIALLMPVLQRATVQSRSTRCQSNLRQISTSVVSYNTDHRGTFVGPRTEGPACGIGTAQDWIHNCPPNRYFSTGVYWETEAALTEGAAFEYIGSLEAYQSPQDPTGRLRSYALSGFLSPYPDSGSVEGSWAPVAWSMARVKNPRTTLLAVPENDEAMGFNLHGWVIETELNIWMDYPAYWNPGGVNLGLMDGSVMKYRFEYQDLPEVVNYHNVYVSSYPETAADFAYFSRLVNINQ